MNIFATANRCRKTRAKASALVASGLLIATCLGVSAFSVQVTQPHKSDADLQPFVGTWQAKFKGTIFHEHAMRSSYLDVRWTLVVSGLEALINVGEDNCAGQFRDRGRQLAHKLKIDLTDDDLRRAYKLRSKLVHAEGFLSQLQTILPENEHSPLYEKLESLLRETVSCCLLDEEFGDSFRNDDAVKARFPSST